MQRQRRAGIAARCQPARAASCVQIFGLAVVQCVADSAGGARVSVHAGVALLHLVELLHCCILVVLGSSGLGPRRPNVRVNTKAGAGWDCG